MAQTRVDIDLSEIEELVRLASRFADDRILRKALRAGIRATGAPIAREVRRAIRKFRPRSKLGRRRSRSGLLAKSITSTLTVDKRTGGFKVRVGARNRKVNGRNPASYFHLFDLGTKPHFQPNAWRPARRGGGFLRRNIGGAFHPGAKAHPVREPASRRAAPELMNRFRKQFDRTLRREIEKASKR